ncbi:MAG: response regulator [Flavobacteriaceae bacterium]|nr:response regulator [Flavobacteriaceae bacterium]
MIKGKKRYITSKKHFYFNITLPTATEEDLRKTNEVKDNNFKNTKVLLVEDNIINVMVAKQILTKEKMKVDIATNGKVAVEKVKQNTYDVILMDINIPIMDGYKATKEIRKFNKEILVLALSASVFMEIKDKISASGMNGFIFKPFNPDELLKQIYIHTKKSN